MAEQVAKTLDLDSAEIHAQRRREWKWERGGWWAMFAFLIAAGSGLVDRGPLSARTSSNADGSLRVDYDAVVHQNAPEVITVELSPASQPVELAVSKRFMQDVSKVEWTPPPRATYQQGEDIVYEFNGIGAEARIRIRFQYDSCGRKEFSIRASDGQVLHLNQVVLP